MMSYHWVILDTEPIQYLFLCRTTTVITSFASPRQLLNVLFFNFKKCCGSVFINQTVMFP